jgi:hypothetical protein
MTNAPDPTTTPAADIVAEIRERHKALNNSERQYCQHCGPWLPYPCDASRAADEIERLRKIIDWPIEDVLRTCEAVIEHGFIDVGYGLISMQQQVARVRAALSADEGAR